VEENTVVKEEHTVVKEVRENTVVKEEHTVVKEVRENTVVKEEEHTVVKKTTTTVAEQDDNTVVTYSTTPVKAKRGPKTCLPRSEVTHVEEDFPTPKEDSPQPEEDSPSSEEYWPEKTHNEVCKNGVDCNCCHNTDTCKDHLRARMKDNIKCLLCSKWVCCRCGYKGVIFSSGLPHHNPIIQNYCHPCVKRHAKDINERANASWGVPAYKSL
jgi:hypothetical protein